MVAKAGMQGGRPWTLAACLVTLMDETDRLFPGRSTASDGSIGNAAHQGQANPDNSFGTEHVADNSGDVRAVDITHDLAAGCDVDRLASALIARQDPRVLYLIRNQRIISSYRAGTVPAWTWRPYVGDPHDHHLHLSTPDDPFTKADTSPWWPTAAAPPVPQEDDDNMQILSVAPGGDVSIPLPSTGRFAISARVPTRVRAWVFEKGAWHRLVEVAGADPDGVIDVPAGPALEWGLHGGVVQLALRNDGGTSIGVLVAS